MKFSYTAPEPPAEERYQWRSAIMSLVSGSERSPFTDAVVMNAATTLARRWTDALRRDFIAWGASGALPMERQPGKLQETAARLTDQQVFLAIRRCTNEGCVMWDLHVDEARSSNEPFVACKQCKRGAYPPR